MTKKREEWMNYWMPKMAPWTVKSQKTDDIEGSQQSKHHGCGVCPITVIIVFCMLGQLVLLKKHEKALSNLEILKRAKEILKKNT